MRVVIFLAVIGVSANLSQASVVTALTASSNVTGGSFATNNAGYPGGAGPPAKTLPATSSIASMNLPSNPPVGTALSSVTLETKDTFDGLNVNTFTWTMTTLGTVDKVTFTFTPISPVNSVFRFAETVAPAGWVKSVANATTLVFKSTTGLKAPAAFAFALSLDLRDVNIPAIQPPGTGSFTLALAASNPEPGSMALCGLASVVAGGFGWRRRRRAAAAAQQLEQSVL